MIRRLWHFWTVGHEWRIVSAAFNQGHGNAYMGTSRQKWGYTEILGHCHCGARKTWRAVGNHTRLTSVDELAELERLAKLK